MFGNVQAFPFGSEGQVRRIPPLDERFASWGGGSNGEGTIWDRVQREMRATPSGALELVGLFAGMPVVHAAALGAMRPDFVAFPLTRALLSQCLIAQERGRYVGVVTDPFDGDLRSGLECTLGASVDWRLAHPADLLACLSMHESNVRGGGAKIS